VNQIKTWVIWPDIHSPMSNQHWAETAMIGVAKANKRVFDQNEKEGVDFEEVCAFGRLNGTSEGFCCFVKSILRIYDCIRWNVLISDWFSTCGAIGICKVPKESFLRKCGTCFCYVKESHVTTICLEHLVHGNNERNFRVISSWDFVLSLFAFFSFEIDGVELGFRQGVNFDPKSIFGRRNLKVPFLALTMAVLFNMFIDFVIF
jgi:hypothetical protein